MSGSGQHKSQKKKQKIFKKLNPDGRKAYARKKTADKIARRKAKQQTKKNIIK